MKLTPARGAKPGRVKLKVHVWGYAYLPLDPDGHPIRMPNPAGTNIVIGTQYRWGDGSGPGGSDGGDVYCGRPHVLRKVEDTYVAGAHTYRPGTYTIRYTVDACGLKPRRRRVRTSTSADASMRVTRYPRGRRQGRPSRVQVSFRNPPGSGQLRG